MPLPSIRWRGKGHDGRDAKEPIRRSSNSIQLDTTESFGDFRRVTKPEDLQLEIRRRKPSTPSASSDGNDQSLHALEG